MLFDSPLESKRFNIKAAKVTATKAEDIAKILQMATDGKYDFLSCRIPTSDISLMQDLQTQGFFLTDTLVYYKKQVVENSDHTLWSSCLQNSSQIQEVIEIANVAFENYPSHYAADRRLNQDAVAEVYKDWASRSFREPTVATDVLVHSEDSKVCAFISVKDSANSSDVQLAAVHPSYQGRGLLSQLLSSVIARSCSLGHKEVTYSTQVQNIAAQKVLIRQGWLMDRSFYTLHRWTTTL